MTLEPAVRAHLDAMDPTPYIGADLPAVRALLRSDIDRMFTLFGLPGPEVHAIDDYEVPALNGPIPIRLYHRLDRRARRGRDRTAPGRRGRLRRRTSGIPLGTRVSISTSGVRHHRCGRMGAGQR